jgi:hypothetical protein
MLWQIANRLILWLAITLSVTFLAILIWSRPSLTEWGLTALCAYVVYQAWDRRQVARAGAGHGDGAAEQGSDRGMVDQSGSVRDS